MVTCDISKECEIAVSTSQNTASAHKAQHTLSQISNNSYPEVQKALRNLHRCFLFYAFPAIKQNVKKSYYSNFNLNTTCVNDISTVSSHEITWKNSWKSQLHKAVAK